MMALNCDRSWLRRELDRLAVPVARIDPDIMSDTWRVDTVGRGVFFVNAQHVRKRYDLENHFRCARCGEWLTHHNPLDGWTVSVKLDPLDHYYENFRICANCVDVCAVNLHRVMREIRENVNCQRRFDRWIKRLEAA